MFAIAQDKVIGSKSEQWLRAGIAAVSQWQRRWRSRAELAQQLRLGWVSERDLRDVGLTRSQVAYEASKPFWQA